MWSSSQLFLPAFFQHVSLTHIFPFILFSALFILYVFPKYVKNSFMCIYSALLAFYSGVALIV